MSRGQRENHAAILRGLAVLFVLCELASRTRVMPSLVAGGLAPLLELPFFAPSLAGAFAVQLVLRPRRDELLATAALAAALAVPILAVAAGRPWAVVNTACSALGIGALLSLGIAALRRRPGERDEVLDVLRPAAILPAFVSLAHPMVYLTAVLWPTTYDHRMYAADWAMGGPLSFTVASVTQGVPLLAGLCLVVYVCLPLALALVHAARQKRDIRSSDALVAFVAVTVVGYAGYHVVPVTGPGYVFGAAFPLSPPDPASLGDARSVALPMPRNCMPSLHSAWALLVWWNARPLAAFARASATAFLAITLLATVALGFHYVVDLVAAFPLTLAAQAWATRVSEERPRRTAILAGLVTTIAWIAAVTWLDAFLSVPAVLLWLVAAAIVAGSCVLERRVYEAREERGAEGLEPAGETQAVGPSRLAAAWAPASALVLLGVAVWLHEAILSSMLAPVVGSTPEGRAFHSVVLVAGFAAGVAASVRLERVIGESARVGALAALALVPWSWLAVEIARTATPSFLGLGPLLALPAAVASGVAAPALMPRSPARPAGAWLAPVFLGAAAGALLTGYAVLPGARSNLLVVALHVVVAVVAVVLAAKAAPSSAGLAAAAASRVRLAAVVGGIVAGVVLAVEAHLVTAMLGDTVYARAQAAVVLLAGMAAGAWAAPRLPVRASPARCLIAMAAVLALTAPLFDGAPAYFASFREYIDRHDVMGEFSQHEFVRFCCAMFFLFPPAAIAGAAMSPSRRGRAASPDGIAAWLLAAACGAGFAAFLLLPMLGSRATLVASAVVAVVAAVPLARVVAVEALLLDDTIAVALLVLALVTATIDVRALATESSLTFRSGTAPPVRAIEESAGSIATQHAGGELRVNGHVRSRNDGRVGADGAPHASALVVGLGSGTTARDLVEAGFARVTVVESVAANVSLVLAEPDALPDGVDVVRADARVVLRDQPASYDLLFIDEPELSVPEATAHCTTEFYALAATRLAPAGVLRQQLALERLSPVALASILASARRAFADVSVLATGNLATLRACVEECATPPSSGRALTLDTTGVDDLLASVAKTIEVPVETLAASDDDLFLRYQTPVSFRAAPDDVPESRTLLASFAREAGSPPPP